MKTYILVDENNIVRCVASEEVNLHQDKLHMDKYHVELVGTVGDEYDFNSDTWISRPENYPQPGEEELREQLIAERKNKIIEDQAIAELIAEGILPEAYVKGEN